MEKLFLAKIENSDDRDVVYYLDFDGVRKDGYFSSINLNGSCFSGFKQELLDVVENDFDSLETIYTKDEIKQLFALDDELDKVKSCINIDKDKIHDRGVKITLRAGGFILKTPLSPPFIIPQKEEEVNSFLIKF